MANLHTSAQRAWIIERLAYGYSANQICERFIVRFPDTNCDPANVHACDPSIVLLGPVEDSLYKNFVKYATENPEIVAPAMNATRRQIHVIQMAEAARERNAVEIAAKLYRQVDEAQGVIGKPGIGKGAEPDKPAAPITEVRRTLVRPNHPEQIAAAKLKAEATANE